VSPEHQLAMVAALAPHVDGAISKTLSVPEHTTPQAIDSLIRAAWRLGLKGISVFRRGSRPGVLSV
jgi:ribonucleoside-diphosphate reductase alpha chain